MKLPTSKASSTEIFELLSGRPAFEGETVTDVLSAIVAKEPDWSALPASTPVHLRALIERCLVKDSRARLRDIGEARIALSLPTTGGPSTSAASTSKRSRRERAAWIVAATAGLAVVAALMRPDTRLADTAPQALQLSVEIPPGMELLQSGDPQLSPDGAQLAFRAIDASGPGLWLYNLRMGGLPRRLPGTEQSVSSAFWSQPTV